jgi:serine/threonine protein phosphatase PrpC
MKSQLLLIMCLGNIAQAMEPLGNVSYEVSVGIASHIGNRDYQEDRANFGRFEVAGKHYHYAMVCDGHGGDKVSTFVTRHLPGMVQKQLESSNINKALLEAFSLCEARIIRKQTIGTIQPGTTVVFSLVDLAGRKRYVANLGDSRMYLYREGSSLRMTQDHHVGLQSEQAYIKKHKGAIQNGYVVLPESPELGGIQVTRALGDCHMKSVVITDENGQDTYGPVNPVPKIYSIDYEESAIELLVSDGFTKEVKNNQFNDLMVDVLTMSSDEFYTEYAHNYGKKGSNMALDVPIEECQGTDDRHKEIARRLVYAIRHVNDTEADLDNVTVLVRSLLYK